MPVYLITYILLFWVPVLIMGFFLHKKVNSVTKKAFWITFAIMTVATFVMEYIYLWLDVWTFSEMIDPLLGIELWGVPIEEFVFWWGASPLFLLMYASYSFLFPQKGKESLSNG
ncbi:hypothetical protein BVX98_01640 [bacterium F11]|nr:hypothetical protein BVX98_01640 [bacterium F11]